MPRRLSPLVNSEFYHVFNRGIDRRPTFTSRYEYSYAALAINYYRFEHPSKRLSYYLKLSQEDKGKLMEGMLKNDSKLVELLAYCFMPNHFHFLLKQTSENGISRFMSQFQNSYTRYFNTRHGRTGALFLNQFKAVHVETDEQLLHVSRYIHLNPLTSFVVKDFDALKIYPWTSLPEYINQKKVVTNSNQILAYFSERNTYENFIRNRVEYQQKLHIIKHLLLEELDNFKSRGVDPISPPR